MKIKYKVISIFMVVLMLTIAVPSSAESIEDEGKMTLTIEQAVEKGLENSIQLKQVENQIDISNVEKRRAKYLGDKLSDGEKQLNDAKKALNNAQSLAEGGEAKEDTVLPGGIVIEKGQTLEEVVGEEYAEAISEQLQSQIEAGREALESGESKLDLSLTEAGEELGEQLDVDGLGSLAVGVTEDLMTTSTDIAYEVTKYSYDIYKNQIAMLIQKSYYDVLKAQKMLEVKEKAVERAKKQYEFVKEGYEAGMKAKDDMLLANVYYKGTQIEYQNAEAELKNAITELKKNMNVPFDTEIELTSVLYEEVSDYDLEEDIERGLKNRLEMKKALGEVVVYDLNFDSVQKKYPKNTFQYKKAKLLKEKARLNYNQTLLEVESSIRQSYQTLMSTGQMLETSKDMVEKAKESLEIAEFKYKEGLGVETSLLKKLDLETAAGTIVEVLAAEENLSEVEEKVVEIMYGYNMARVKYLNDTGKFIY